MGWSIVASLVSFAFSTISQRRAIKKQKERQRKMQEEAAARADAAKGISIVAEGEALPLKVVYGRALVGGVRVYHTTTNSLSYVDQGFGSGVNGVLLNNGLGFSASGRKHEFLFVQQAITFGPIASCKTADVDNMPYSEPKFNTHGNDEPNDGVDDGHGGLQISVFYDGGIIDPLMVANIGGDRDKAYFVNTAYATCVFRLNRDDPQFNGVPSVQFYIEGLLVKDIIQLSEGVYAVDNLGYSNNPVRCLLDYLMNPIYGRGLSVEDIDLESFYRARDICNKIVMDSVPPEGKFWKNTGVVLTTNAGANTVQFSRMANRNAVLKTGSKLYIKTGGGGLTTGSTYWVKTINSVLLLDTVTLSSAPDLSDTVTLSNSTSAVMYQTRHVHLFECNVGLDTSKTIRDNIEVLLESMGLAELIWSAGKYKLMLAYPRVHTLGNLYKDSDLLQYQLSASEVNIFRNTVDNNTLLPPGNGWYEDVAIRMDDDDIVRGEEITISWPNAASRFNSITVRYRNEAYDFVEDTVTWPKKSNYVPGANTAKGNWAAATAYNKSDIVDYGGKKYQLVIGKDRVVALDPSSDSLWIEINPNDVYRTYLAEDNDLPLETEIFEESAVSYYHALAKAEQRCRSSRANTLYKLTVTRKYSNLEPGDFIHVSSSILGIPNELLRIEEVDITDKGMVVIEAYKFDARILAWNIADNEIVNPRVILNDSLGQAKNLAFSASSNFTTSIGTVTWDSADDNRVVGYIVKYTTTPIASISMSTQWIDLGTAGRNSFEVPSLPSGTYTFTVVSKSRSEQAKREDWPTVSSSLTEISFNSAMALPLSIYKRSVSEPTTPTGGVFDFDTLSITTVPTDWSTGIPSGSNTLFVSTSTAFSDTGLGEDTTLTWSTPAALSRGVVRVTSSHPTLFVLKNKTGNFGYDDADSNVILTDGGSDVTASAAYSIQSLTGCTATVNNTDNKGFVSVTDLTGDSGYVVVRATYLGANYDIQLVVQSVLVNDAIDLTTPPTLTSATITPGFSNFYISVPAQVYTEGGGHDKTLVYAANAPASVFADATLLCEFDGTMEVYPSSLGVTKYFWFKNRSRAGVLSAEYGGTNGISATTGKVGSNDLSPLIIEAQHLADGSIVAGKLAANSIAVGSAAIQDGAITNAMISNLTADKILSGQVQAAQEISVGDNIKLSGDGWIETYSGANFSRNADYARVSSGEISLYKYITALGTSVKYSYLSRLETGTATNNTVVVIPGYWKVQPRILVSPAVLALYNPTYSTQPQALNCAASNIQETAPGSQIYQFTPSARLELAAYSNSVTPNENSGVVATNSWTSAVYTTPANCNMVTVDVRALSARGNGSGSNFYRQVKYRVEYFNGSWITTDSLKTISIGAQTATEILDNKTFTFPSSSTWQFRIYMEASDVGGTFGSASPSATSQETLTSSGVGTCKDLGTVAGATTNTYTLTFPPSVLNTSWEIYQISYFTNYNASFEIQSFLGGSGAPHGTFSHTVKKAGAQAAYYVVDASHYVAYQGIYDNPGSLSSGIISGSSLSYNQNYFSCSMYAYETNVMTNATNPQCVIFFTDASVTIHRRTYSTAPLNTYKVSSLLYNLTAAQVISTGTINWIAAGE